MAASLVSIVAFHAPNTIAEPNSLIIPTTLNPRLILPHNGGIPSGTSSCVSTFVMPATPPALCLRSFNLVTVMLGFSKPIHSDYSPAIPFLRRDHFFCLSILTKREFTEKSLREFLRIKLKVSRHPNENESLQRNYIWDGSLQRRCVESGKAIKRCVKAPTLRHAKFNAAFHTETRKLAVVVLSTSFSTLSSDCAGRPITWQNCVLLLR